MSVSCTTSATLTRTELSTTTELVPTSFVTTSTVPGHTTTSTVRTCIEDGSASACVSTTFTSLITVPPAATTLTLPTTVSLTEILTGFVTEFASECTTLPDPSTTPPTSDPPLPPTSTSPSLSPSLPPLSSDSPPPTSSDPPPIPTTQTDSSPARSTNVGAIVGGTLGGIAALLILAFFTFKFIKNQRRFDDFFNDVGDVPVKPYRKDPVVDKPKPYDYGIVGQQDSTNNRVGFSPPHSPPPGNYTNDIGYHPAGHTNDIGTVNPTDFGDYTAPNQAPPQHIRNASLTPLLVGVAGAAAASGAGAAAAHSRSTTASSRPSTSGSTNLLGPVVSHATAPQNMGYPPQPQPSSSTAYPPALQSYAQQQLPHSGPGHGLAHNPSATSSLSMYSTTSSGAPLVPGQQPHQPNPMPYHQQNAARYADPFARSGSPVSIQEQRILQVTNAEPSTNRESTSTYTSTVPGTSSSPPPGPSSLIDGKGRPLNTRGEKAALVHLDGGAYQLPSLAEASTAPVRGQTPAPPAYDG